MIIATTPLSLMLIGDRRAALSLTIHAHERVVVHQPAPPFRNRFTVRHRETEHVNAISDIRHPLIRNALNYLRIRDGLDLTVISDLPDRESPTTRTLSLLHALHAFRQDEVNAEELARETLILRQEDSDRTGAPFVAYASAYGGLCRLALGGWNHYEASPIRLDTERLTALRDRLIVFLCDHPPPAPADVRPVPDAQALLESQDDLDTFGQLLHDPDQRDPRYLAARDAGALGGTFTADTETDGFLLLYAPPETHAAIRAALGDLTELPFRFCMEGSRTTLLDTP